MAANQFYIVTDVLGIRMMKSLGLRMMKSLNGFGSLDQKRKDAIFGEPINLRPPWLKYDIFSVDNDFTEQVKCC